MTTLTSAERILIGLGISEPKEIDLDAIAWSRGAVVKYRLLEKCEAMIVGSQRRAIITVNSESLPTRQRFSLAHEIGHWRHHRGRILYCGTQEIGNPSDGVSNPEKQADEFASDLILPSYMLRPRIAKVKRLTLPVAREFAEEFQASLTATLIKLVTLDILPIVVVCHNRQRRRWFRRANMVPGWWFPREDLDAESFAFGMLFGGVGEDRLPRKVGADAWFGFRNVGRYEVQEQSFLLPNSEILTMLIIPDDGLD